MTITSEQRDDILEVVVGLFNAAPGGSNLTELANVVEGGASISQLADLLAAHPLFTDGIMAGKVTTEDQVQVLMDHFGVVADDDATSAGSQAEAYFTAQLEAGAGFGQIIVEATSFLSTTEDPLFADAAALLANKVLVAREYSERYSSSDLNVLQSILGGVTSNGPATEAAAIAYLSTVVIPNPTNLTFGEDNLTGTAANDTFVAGIVNDGNGTLVNSLQNADILNGSGGTDTLNATLNDGGTVTPALTSVEIVNLRDLSSTIVDFTDASEVEQIWNSTSSAAETLTYNAAPIAATFGVRNTKSTTDIDTFDDVTGTEDNLSLAVENAGSDTVDAVIDSSTDAASIETMSIAATGESFIDVTAFNAITSLTVTGAGTVDAAVDITALETVDASGNSGGVIVDLTGAANDLTVTGGSGDDDVTAGAGDDTIDAGEGDDRVAFASAALDNLDTVEGGDGEDTFALIEGDDVTELDATVHTGFEVLELGAATAGGNTFDNEDFGFTKIVLAGDAQGVTLDNLEAGTVEVEDNQTGAGIIVTSVGDDDSVNVVTNAEAAVTIDALDVTGVETVNVSTTADTDDTTFTAIETDGVTALTFAGAGDVIITDITDADNTNDGDASIENIDLTAQTGGVEMTANNLGYGTTFTLANLGETATASFDFDDDAAQDEASELFATDGFRDTFAFTTEFTGDVAITSTATEFGGDVTDDRLDLSFFGLGGIDDLTFTDVADGLLIENDAFGGGRILLVGVTGADVNTNDFVF